MHRLSRRQLLYYGLPGLACAGMGYVNRNGLARRLRGAKFDAFEVSTPLRRSIWPIHNTSAGWEKSSSNPVLGGALGSCFDVSVLRQDGSFVMWFSWREKGGIGRATSSDGIRWDNIQLVLAPSPDAPWCGRINRPTVIYEKDKFRMWFTGQSALASAIGLAESADGISWARIGSGPIFEAKEPWELNAVMAPHVMWDVEQSAYKMWYSAGGQFEPVAVGYAESEDGYDWVRRRSPVFAPSPGAFDCDRVTGATVVREGAVYLMFYIGFRNVEESAICLARSTTGIDGWQRSPSNPLIAPGRRANDWDYDAVYKPSVIRMSDCWMMWYNGRKGRDEQIGLAIHPGVNISF